MFRKISRSLPLFLIIFFTPVLNGQTSLDEIISDMALPHEGRPHGVPVEFDWGTGPRSGAEAPPESWDAAIAWGQLYEWVEGNPATNTRVQIRDLELYYLSRTDRKWHLLQSAVLVEGAAYVEDFAGDVNQPADIRNEADGSLSVTAGEGYNFHFWPKEGRINYPENDVMGCYATVRARLVLDDPEGPDDRDSAGYVMSVGGDWWESLTAVWDNWTTNADMGIGRFRFVTRNWKSFNMITLPEDTVRKYPPPFHTAGPYDLKPYQDTSLTVEARVEDLLWRMTLKEKAGQMTQASWSSVNPTSDMKTWFLGSLLNGGGGAPANNTPVGWADLYDGFQDLALDTRLGIPYLYGTDAVHGHNNLRGAVIFPHHIGMGCTRNEALAEEAARITAFEVAATGVDWTFAPCITVPRDERWGRSYEGFSEDPELVSRLGAAEVRGFQGDSLSDPATILACAKHYVGDGGTTGGDDQGNTILSEEELRRIHLPPYIDAVSEGVGTVMASYSSWNGEKLHGHKYLLTNVLKEELGFEGFIVSDWAGINQLPGDYTSDVETSINAGIDMVMVPDNYRDFINALVSLVNEGRVSWERIEDANRRILTRKFEMGLFESPYTDRAMAQQVGSPEHRQVARQCVRESLVVLKNKNRILPLAKDDAHIHLAGKSADNLGYQCGGWTISWQGGSGDITEGTTILEAVRDVADGVVTYTEAGYSAEADGAKVAVVVIGETPYAEGNGDRSDLGLDQGDIDAVRSLYQNGFKVVTVLISGRPLLLEKIWHYSDAVIAAWLPGTEGTGITDLLFGDHQPSGKLSFTWPAGMEQIPINIGDTLYEPFLPYGFGTDTFALPLPADPPVPFSAATGQDGASVEITFDKPMQVPLSPLVDLSINNAPSAVENISLKIGDPNTLVLSPDRELSSQDLIRVSSPGGIEAEDGSVSEAFSLLALNDIVQYLAVPGRIEAEAYSSMSGIQTEPCTDEGGGLNVGYIEAGDYMVYRVDIAEPGVYSIDFRVASQSNGGAMKLQIAGGSSWTDLQAISFDATGGWQEWVTVTDTASLPAGRQSLRLFATKEGFNVNWFELTPWNDVYNGQDKVQIRLNAWPNPVEGTLYLSADINVPIRYSVCDATGKRCAGGTFRNSCAVDGTSWGKGLYIIQFDTGNNLFFMKIIVR
jgi:beta-glucosidase